MYNITEWHQRYEVSISGSEAKSGDKLRVGPLRYIRLKVHGYQQGTGMRKLRRLAGNRTMEVFGIFCKFLELSGDLCKSDRGQLLNEDGNSATAKDLAFILDVPEEQIEHAILMLLDKDVHWLTETKQNTTQHNSTHTETQGSEKLPEVYRNLQNGAEPTLPPSDSATQKPPTPNPILTAWAKRLGKDKACPADIAAWHSAEAVHGQEWCLYVMGKLDITAARPLIVEAEKQKLKVKPIGKAATQESMADFKVRAEDAWKRMVRGSGSTTKAAQAIREGKIQKLGNNPDKGIRGGDPGCMDLPAEKFLELVGYSDVDAKEAV